MSDAESEVLTCGLVLAIPLHIDNWRGDRPLLAGSFWRFSPALLLIGCFSLLDGCMLTRALLSVELMLILGCVRSTQFGE